MTAKKNDNDKEVKEEVKTKKADNGKYVLSDLVLESDVKYTKIILELSRVGLLKQYNEELSLRGQVDLTPSITKSEFDKIIDGR